MKFNWVFEIKNLETELQKIISERDDLRLVLQILQTNNGIEAFIKLYEEFNKSSIKFVERTITSLKRIYCIQNRYMSPEKLRRLLDVDIQTIYSWWRQGHNNPQQIKMFDEGNK